LQEIADRKWKEEH